MKTTCIEINDIDAPIKLIQSGIDRFEVHYGLQVNKDLNYIDAAAELGSCIMHALACASRLDNRTKK